ncbi:hypothetical protein [uncultured Pontibacter sp.]|uniref:hypothetical protein n=1 Tax=uncultured Pontibacter sp. TaxID=453356 RepID=UPI00262C336E|nr:hypothetical protein [uncultured Pontibacter sp.]
MHQKPILIRFILFASASAMLSATTSCDRNNDRINRKYVLENGTEHEIKVEFYRFGRQQKTASITGAGLIAEGVSSNDAGKTISAQAAFATDSVIVTFDDEKQQVYTNIVSSLRKNISPEFRNILVDSSYERESNSLYRFIFIEEDYDKAEDCK